MIPFSEFRPDMPELDGAGRVALNVVPRTGGYAPFFAPTRVADPIGNRAQGAIAIKDLLDNTSLFVGDVSKLYLFKAGAWDDVSSMSYSTEPFDRWEFTQFGVQALAVNGTNLLQRYNMTSGTAFINIPASPVAQHITVVKDFVVVSTLVAGEEIRWSANNNPDEWTPLVNSSGAQPLQEGGPIRGLTGGEYCTILQENQITRMSFVGGDLVFQFDPIEQARGCIASGSIGQLGLYTYYWSEHGIEVFNGVEGSNIGEGKVNRHILDNLDRGSLDRISVAVDPFRRLIIWAYPTKGSGGVANKFLCFYVGEGRFSEIELDVEILVNAATNETSIDEITTSIDAVPVYGDAISLDELTGERVLGMFDTDHGFNHFSGLPMNAKVATGETSPSGLNHTIISRLRPMVDDTEATVTIRHRSTQQAAIIEDAPLPMRPDGSVPSRVNDRYVSFQVDLTGDNWTIAQGIDIEEAVKSGRNS